MRLRWAHWVRLAAYVFGVIFIAELPDKTALAALVLATRHRALPVFLGAALALTVQSIVAVAAGSLFGLLPPRLVHIAAGVVFIVSAVIMWIRRNESQDEDEKDATGAAGGAPADGRSSFARSFGTVFAVVFAAEWGDLTQLATAAFAARERAPLVVLCSSTAALWAVTAIAVGVGNRAARFIHPAVVQSAAALLFLAVGIALLAGLM
jgi:putative Ca2+/H+ antiporter (TMEM165/GDT1 family)